MRSHDGKTRWINTLATEHRTELYEGAKIGTRTVGDPHAEYHEHVVLSLWCRDGEVPLDAQFIVPRHPERDAPAQRAAQRWLSDPLAALRDTFGALLGEETEKEKTVVAVRWRAGTRAQWHDGTIWRQHMTYTTESDWTLGLDARALLDAMDEASAPTPGLQLEIRSRQPSGPKMAIDAVFDDPSLKETIRTECASAAPVTSGR